MNQINYARFLERMSFFIAGASIFGVCAKWSHDIVIKSFDFDHSFLMGLFHYTWHDAALIEAMPVFHRMLGFAIDVVALSIFILGLRYVILFARAIAKGHLFNKDIIIALGGMSSCALWWAIYAPIQGALLSIVMSLHNPPGSRAITISFGSDDIINIFVCIFLMLIVLLIKEAYYLKQEQDLII